MWQSVTLERGGFVPDFQNAFSGNMFWKPGQGQFIWLPRNGISIIRTIFHKSVHCWSREIAQLVKIPVHMPEVLHSSDSVPGTSMCQSSTVLCSFSTLRLNKIGKSKINVTVLRFSSKLLTLSPLSSGAYLIFPRDYGSLHSCWFSPKCPCMYFLKDVPAESVHLEWQTGIRWLTALSWPLLYCEKLFWFYSWKCLTVRRFLILMF